MNLTSKQSFIDGFTNDFDNFSNTLFANLEGTSLEQREWLKEAVKEIKNPDLFKYASSYFTTNFNTYSSPVAEYNIFLEMQKIDKNFSDRNISQGITDNINNNYKNCQETFKEILNTMIEEKIPGLFSSITENKEDIIEKALYSIDNNALNEYLKNTATDNEMISIISNKSIKSIYYKNAIDIVKIYNDKNIKDKNDKLNDIFNSYISQDFKINDRDLNHDKENKQRIKDMLEYLLTTNNTKITLDKKKFSDLFYNINNEILLNYINNINTQDTNKLTYLSEFQKELFGYNQPIEKITKLFETMKNKNLELSANAITDDFIIKSYINAKDSQQQKNIKKYIRTTLGYMTSLKDLKIDNDFSLLSKVLITKEDRKEFYELLSKNSNNLPQDLVKKTIGMIVSSNNDDNLISYMKNYKKMMLDEAKRILGIYQSLNQNTYKKQIDNINKLTESIENL